MARMNTSVALRATPNGDEQDVLASNGSQVVILTTQNIDGAKAKESWAKIQLFDLDGNLTTGWVPSTTIDLLPATPDLSVLDLTKTSHKSKIRKQKPRQGSRVVGVTKDGVRILESKSKATHFTTKEIREAVANVRAKNA